jgi:hypothetical protein
MNELEGKRGCWMRLGYHKDRTKNIEYIDKLFTGNSDDELKWNIDWYIQKYGIRESYVITIKENENGDESTQISSEETQEKIKEKAQTV